MTAFIDACILIIAMKPNEDRYEWCLDAMANARINGPLIVSDVAYSEFSGGMESKEAADQVTLDLRLERLPFSDEVLFRAGQAYVEHVRRGGTRSTVLPDFLIGAQALIEDAPLITTNGRDFRSYFPQIAIIAF